MISRLLVIISFLLVLFSCTSNQLVKSKSDQIVFHTPKQIYKIMEHSKLNYKIDILDSTFTLPEDSSQILNPLAYFYFDKDSIPRFGIYSLGFSAEMVFLSTEIKFREEKYDSALIGYKKVLKLAPDFAHAYTLSGDAFYHLGNMDSSIYYFKKAISMNPIDYQAYWFMGDAYNEKNMLDSAYYYLLRAHILNKHHETLQNKVKDLHALIFGKEWDDWQFRPQYYLEKENDSVFIHAKPFWLGYAMAKAVWRYEPGYAQSMIGKTLDSTEVSTLEEAEAVTMLLNTKTNLTAEKEFKNILQNILEMGYLDEFILYEIVGDKNLWDYLLRVPFNLNRVAEYLVRFH